MKQCQRRTTHLCSAIFLLLTLPTIALAQDIITTVAGNGYGVGTSIDGGPATSASLGQPEGVVVDAAGNLYIPDRYGHKVRKIDSAGIITTVAGSGVDGFSGDGGPAINAQLNNPTDLALDAAGNLYIADLLNYRIRKIDAVSGAISTVAGNGSSSSSGDGGLATNASIGPANDLAVDAAANLYIVDNSNNRVRKIDAATGIINTVAGDGSVGFGGDGGPATSAQFQNIFDIALDTANNLYIADASNRRVRKVDAVTGIVTTVAGDGTFNNDGDGGLAINTSLFFVGAVGLDAAANLYISDNGSNRVRKVDAVTGIITTAAGNNSAGFGGDGVLAIATSLFNAQGLAIDAAGNLYIADTQNNRVRKVDAVTGIINTVGGNGEFNFSGDGGPATNASLAFPQDAFADASGNLYIADYFNNRIRKVDAASGNINTIHLAPGTLPTTVTAAANGDIYFATYFNVYKIDATTSVVSVFSGGGTGATIGDGGPATAAKLFDVRGINLDTSGNLYIADFFNYRIRKVDAATGIISTVAGNGNFGNSGNGGPALAASVLPDDVAVDAAGNLYIASSQSGGGIRKVDAVTGIISTVTTSPLAAFSVAVDAGGDLYTTNLSQVLKIDATTGTETVVGGDLSGAFGFSGDGGPATSALLNYAFAVAIGPAGDLFVTDANNHRIRKIGTPPPPTVTVSIPPTTASYAQSFTVPVQVDNTSGHNVVAAELFVAFDGDLLTAFSVATTATLVSPNWSVETNVIQGVATPFDTLKIAMATDTDALVGAGDLIRINFQTIDQRSPGASPLDLVHALFNDGNPASTPIGGAFTLIGADGQIVSSPATIIPRQSVQVTVTEPDEDRDPLSAETLIVSVSNGTQTEALSVAETGLNTGIFSGQIATAFSLAPSSGDGIVQAQAGDQLVFAYDDLLDAAGNTVVRQATTNVLGGVDGVLRLTAVTQPGDTVRVRLTDADLNTNAGLQEITTVTAVNGTTGENETLTLTELGTDNAIFFGIVKTAPGTVAGTNDDGTFNTQKGDLIVATYSDTLTALGGTTLVDDTDTVVDPFGDADGNGNVQAFDASQVLSHVLAPFLTGLDSLSANVDGQAPFSTLTPFDASLTLQRVVNLIDRFPVQEDEADNHPQPETDNSVPKLIPDERVLALESSGGYLSLVLDERRDILSGELLIEGVSGPVEIAEEMGSFIVAHRRTTAGLRIVFAGAQAITGAGELLRLYGVGPDGAQLVRAHFNDGRIAARHGDALPTSTTPATFALDANVPNPFNPETAIPFALAQASSVRLEIFDMLGQRVRTLVQEQLSAGSYRVLWDGRNEQGLRVGSGVYLYRLRTGSFTQIRRMLLLK